MKFAVFDNSSRRVLRVHSVARAKSLSDHGQELGPNEAIAPCPALGFDQIYASQDGQIVAKQPKNYTASKQTIFDDGSDSTRIEGLTPGTRVQIRLGSDVVYSEEINESFIEFSADLAGVYIITIDEVEFLKGELEIECIA